MVLFDAETLIIKQHIENDRFVKAKPAIDDVIQKARNAGFGTDGFLIGELLHLKDHVEAWIEKNDDFQKGRCIRTIIVIRNIQ